MYDKKIAFWIGPLYLKYFRCNAWMLCIGKWGIGVIHKDNKLFKKPYDDV